MAAIENFILRFKVEGSNQVKQISGAIQGLSGDIAAFGVQGGVMGNTLNSLLGRMGPVGVAAGALGGAFAALGMKAISLADAYQDLADATGLTASEIASFKVSVIDAGGSADDYAQILAKLNQSIQESAAGNEKFKKAFQDMGVYVLDANGKLRPTSDILQNILEKFRSGEITAQQYAASIDILGKGINRLDLTKLEAINDPFKDEKIAQLAKYQTAIDKIAASINDALITAFGSLAIEIDKQMAKIDEVNKKADQRRTDTERKLNEQGRTGVFKFGDRSGQGFSITPGGGLSREMTPQELADYAAGKGSPGLPNLPTPPKAPSVKQPKGGSFGGTTDAERRLSSELKIIENMSVEYGKTLELENQRYEAGTRSMMQIGTNAEKMTQLTQMDLQYKQELMRIDKQIFDLEANGWVAGNAAKIAALKKEKTQYEETYDAARVKMIELMDTRHQELRSFETGWERAFGKYIDQATNAATIAESLFNSMTQNMNAALDNFVETGKFSFSDFAESVIKDIIKIQLRAAAANFIGSMGGAGAGPSGLLGAIGGLFKATGGPVTANKPYIVGDGGRPELFIPNTSGTILPAVPQAPNGSTTIINNISAIDAKSVAQLFAENRQVLFGTVEQARRELPMRTR